MPLCKERLPFETCFKLYIVSARMGVWLCRPCAHTATRAAVPASASWPAANSAVRRRRAGKLVCAGAHSQLGETLQPWPHVCGVNEDVLLL